MRSMRLWLLAIAVALSGCSPTCDCRSKAVHDKLFSMLRDNFYDVLGKTDEPSLRGIAAIAGVAGLVAGVAQMADQQDADRKFDRSILEQLRAFPQTARFALNLLTEEEGDRDRNKHSCRANVRIEATIPDQFADALRQLPFLGVNAKGEVSHVYA